MHPNYRIRSELGYLGRGRVIRRERWEDIADKPELELLPGNAGLAGVRDKLNELLGGFLKKDKDAV